ncbi:MAG: TRAP transporter large permease subunit, partial [Atribacterota bacterium]|nr:TRAP transporter large permease subunit [Atribacterota bacterium]
PDYVIDVALKLNLNYVSALLFVFVLYAILGTFMSGVPAIITFMPIIQAIGHAGGVHPIHLGVVACVTMAVGLITPPYGICLLLACKLGNINTMSGFKSIIIFIIFFIIIVVFCIIFPDIILWLPSLIIPNFS